MTELADFVVIDRNRQEVAPGKWTSPEFSAGGRKVLSVNGVERHNAHVTLTFRVPSGVAEGHIEIRIIVNGHPLPELVFAAQDTMNTSMAAFPASYLKNGGGNLLELHSRGEKQFYLTHAVAAFRQDS